MAVVLGFFEHSTAAAVVGVVGGLTIGMGVTAWREHRRIEAPRQEPQGGVGIDGHMT